MSDKQNTGFSIRNWYANLQVRGKIHAAIILITLLIVLLISSLQGIVLYNNVLSERMVQARQNLSLVHEKILLIQETLQNDSKLALTHSYVQDVLRKSVRHQEVLSFDDYNTIQSPLNSIVFPHSLIDSFVIYAYDGQIHHSGALSNIQPLSKEVLGELQRAPRRVLWENTRISPYVQDQRSYPVISMYRIIFDYHSGMPLGILMTSVREEVFSSSFQNVAEETETEIFLVSYEGDIISHGESSRLFGNISSEAYFDDILQQIDGQAHQIDGNTNYLLTKHMPSLGGYLIGFVPQARVKGNVSYLIIFVLVTALLGIAVAYYLSQYAAKTITQPIGELVETMNHAGEGDLEVRVTPAYQDEIGKLGEEFNGMLTRISQLMDSVHEEHQKKLEHEFTALQVQVNPHFLYNTLEAIQELAKTDHQAEVEKIISNLGSFYRSVLSKGRNIVSLAEEFATVKSYLEILEIRYSHTFIYWLELPDALKDASIVKLTLQPLVENAVYHGLKYVKEGGELRISAVLADEDVLIHVTDNGCGMEHSALDQLLQGAAEQDRIGFGMKNVNDRIHLYYGNAYGLSGATAPGEGTRITVRIPKRRMV